MRERARSIMWVVAVAGAGMASVVLWRPGWLFAVLVVAYVASHLATIPNASGRSISLAPGVAGVAGLISGGSLVLVLGAAAVGLPLSWSVAHVRYGSRATSRIIPSEQGGIAAFAVLFAGATALLPSQDPSHPVVLLAFAAASVLGFFAAVALRVHLSERRRVVTRRLIAMQAFSEWPAYAALFASAALFAVTLHSMGIWAVPLAAFPYGFSHISLSRLQTTRRTYDQTIGALGAIPEATGLVGEGHTTRTAELAVAVGAEIGLGTRAIRRLEHAALLHDIGRVVLSNPAVAAGEHTSVDVSQWSAAIIGDAGSLHRVSAIVGSQHAPYRREGQVRDEAVPRESQVIRVVAHYDSAVMGGDSPLAALESLYRGAAYDYDPRIVGALRTVLERRNALAA